MIDGTMMATVMIPMDDVIYLEDVEKSNNNGEDKFNVELMTMMTKQIWLVVMAVLAVK